MFGVAEADTRAAGGELVDVDGAISTYEDLSWGAGEGAIAMAVLIVSESRDILSLCKKSCWSRKSDESSCAGRVFFRFLYSSTLDPGEREAL